MAKNVVVENGEVTDFVLGEYIDLVCCDRGLTHVCKHIVEDGVLKIEWWRNNRSTAQYRRHRNYPLLKE